MSDHRVTISGRCLGQVIQNVIHVRNQDGVLSHTAIKDEFVANWITPIKAAQVSAFLYEALEVRDVGIGAQPVTSFPLGQIPGLNAGSGILNVGAFVIQKRTGLTGRQNRGRLYLGGPRADWTSNNLINAAGVGGMGPILTSLKSRWCTGGNGPLKMLIIGRGGDNPHIVNVAELILATGIGIQRRRNINVGI